MRLATRTALSLIPTALLAWSACTPMGGNSGNTAPVADDQSVDVMIDTPQIITLVARDVDGGPQPLVYAIVTAPNNGTLSSVVGDKVTYTPDPMFAGLDRFTFRANDGAANSNEAEVCIEVTASPQPISDNDCSIIGGGSNDDDGDDGNDGEDEGDPMLTVDIAVSQRANFARVVGFVNKGLVNREDAESSVTAWDFTATFANGSVSRFVGSFPPGTEICLVSDESQDLGTSPTAFDISESPTAPSQFVQWEGDTGDSSPGDDKGVLFFILESDRTILARFDDKASLVVRTDGGALGGGTILDYEFLSQEPLTIPPVRSGNANNINFVGTGLTGQAGLIQLTGWFNSATRMRLCVPGDWPFSSWSGDGAISGRCVTLDFMQSAEVTLRWP